MTSIENTNNNHPFPFHSLTKNDFKHKTMIATFMIWID
jgi:hypothetical protein